MKSRSVIAFLAGLMLVIALGAFAAEYSDTPIAKDLTVRAKAALIKSGAPDVTPRFYTEAGSPTRHPLLSGGENLDEATRDRAAKAVGAISGVGSVQWIDGTARQSTSDAAEQQAIAGACQGDVEALLSNRTIRFEESSSAIEPASQGLIDEVAEALRPCLGSIIAITGHTDSSGSKAGNMKLSQARADSVRAALIKRGIPADGLRADGVGSSEPVDGLSPSDPANRRIEFSVIAMEPVDPTPVDAPGAR